VNYHKLSHFLKLYFTAERAEAAEKIFSRKKAQKTQSFLDADYADFAVLFLNRPEKKAPDPFSSSS
jgi:hypothetical protein